MEPDWRTAAHQERRCDERDGGERDFRDDQHPVPGAAARAGRRAAAFLERFRRPRPRHDDRRHQAEENRGPGRDDRREGEQTQIEAGLVEPRDRHRHRRDADLDERERRHGPGARTGGREQQALDEHLSHQPETRRANGGANGHLPSPGAGAREQQARDVDASGQQEHGDGPHQHEQRGAIVAEHVIEQRLRPRGPSAVRGGELAAEPRAERGELARGGVDRRARREPRHRLHEMGAAAVLREVPLQPQPQIDVVRIVKPPRHDADDRVGRTGKRIERPAHDGRIRAVLLTPEPVADDGDPNGVVQRLLFREPRSELRRHAQQLEQVVADFDRPDTHGILVRLRQIDLGPPPGCRFAERRQRAIIHEVHGGQRLMREVPRVVGFPDRHELVRRAERQRPQQHRVDDAEDGRGGAGAQAEREHGDRGERGRSLQLPKRVAELSGQPGERIRPGLGRRGPRPRVGVPRGASRQLGERRLFQRVHRPPRGAGLIGPLGECRLIQVLEVRRQLRHGGRGQRRVSAPCRVLANDLRPVHGATPAMVLRAVKKRAQSSRCAASARRPSTVRR